MKHVLFIVQENRTPDNLMHGLPGADVATAGLNSKGERIVLQPLGMQAAFDLDHAHSGFLALFDRGRMDGGDRVRISCPPHVTCPPNAPFSYVPPAEVTPYFDMAEQYTFGDRMFETQQGPSFPAHQFLISGTSAPNAGSVLFAAENPQGGNAKIFSGGGCDGATGDHVALIDPSGNETTTVFPCFEHQTLMDLLVRRGLTWKYYAPTPNSIWTGPDAINHIRFGTGFNNVIVPETKVLTDIAAGRLASVTWVVPSGQWSDHLYLNNGSGPSWVAAIVNAVGTSAFWKDTVIFVTWDDWGGWYDHVPPPVLINSYEYGIRVPLIVVSAYAKHGYVSHKFHDFGSLLKFTEIAFGLGSLGYADAPADDLGDSFDFTRAPSRFRPIPAPLPPSYFINYTGPALPPDPE